MENLQFGQKSLRPVGAKESVIVVGLTPVKRHPQTLHRGNMKDCSRVPKGLVGSTEDSLQNLKKLFRKLFEEVSLS